MSRGDHFRGRSVIVTGGASGIGLALGTALAAQGAEVVLADIDADAVTEAAASVQRPGQVTGRRLDVCDRQGFDDLVAEVCEEHGGLDYLFNNAGISLGGPTEEMTGPYWDRITAVNLGGVVNGVLAAYPRMVVRGKGHIVNTASAAGLMAAPFAAGYTMTKHAVVGLTLALRPEAASVGVRVTALCPGMVETPILDRLPPDDLPARQSSALTGREYLTTAGLSPISADHLAAAALAGVAKNRAIVVAPASARLGWTLSRLSPRAIEMVGRRTVRRVRAQMGRNAGLDR